MVLESLKKYQKQHDQFIEYGTAGFRTRADLLEHIMFRMGLLATLRSMKTKAAVGLMITASHNPEEDNGIKMVDPNGEMLDSSWEKIATILCNTTDDNVLSYLENIIKSENIDTINFVPHVIMGHDTRPSSDKLSIAAKAGICAMSENPILSDFGLVTTPMLHYFVVCTNTNHQYGLPSVDGYLKKISNAYNAVRGTKENNQGSYIAELQLDAANGVGAIPIELFQKCLCNNLIINVFNNGKDGELNKLCGADYVKIHQQVPINFPKSPNVRCVSIDGDADRIVYFYTDEENKFHLLDGDKIATLIAGYFKELLEESGLHLQLALVQTAYANGSSTEYITQILKVPVFCVPTGVKHLHHKAKQFDIGVYFEANGHGTVVFSDQAITQIKNRAMDEQLPENKRQAASTFASIIDMINQTVGDALCDMLVVETILHAKRWDLKTWEQCYNDLPCRQIKVKVADRKVFKTSDAERHCDEPAGLQDKINQLVAKYNKGRSFVRPSGTEDVVRVYAEAENDQDVDNLASEVVEAVKAFTESL